MSELPVSGSYRPTIMGTNGMVSSGHYLATLAGERILARGGNAVDAGVAAGLCLCVLHIDMVNKDGKPFMPLGTPGGDVQCQAMLQVFLNIGVFGMEAQTAIEAPRFATYSYPGSFEPHEYHADELRVERRLAAAVGDALAAKGHKVVTWPDWTWRAGGVCTITIDRARGILTAGADPRRMGYAIGW